MLALSLALHSPSFARDKVAVVVSDTLSAYTDPVAPFLERLGQSVEVLQIHGRVAEARAAVGRLREVEPKAVYCVGAKACYAVHESLPEVPLVYSTIMDPARYGIEGSGVTGVTMEVDPITYLSQFTGLFPQVASIGVIRGPSMTEREWLAMSAAAVELDLAVVAHRVRTSKEVRAAAVVLSKKDLDAIWVPPDRAVLTSDNYRTITEEARRRHLPLLVDNQNMVEAGGLYTLTPDARAVGQQAAVLVERILEGEPVRTLAPEAPERLLVVLNAATLERAEIEFDKLLLDFVDVVVD